MEAIVGIDIGTSNIKVIAFSREGTPIYSSIRRNTVINNNKFYDFDGQYIYNKILEMLRELVERKIKIVSIGVSSLAETVFPISFKKEEHTRAIAWYDTRTEEQKVNFFRNFNEIDFFRITGLKPKFSYTIHKLQWYYKYMPDLFFHVKKWAPINSYIVYRLTGNLRMDYTLAGRTGGLNIKKQKWSKKIFKHLAFSPVIFPKLVHSGVNIGFIDKKNMEILGIDYNVPVSLGGHDHICGSYAAIAYRENVMLDSMGTAENILSIINPDQIHMEAIYKKGIGMGPYILPNKVYIYKAFDYSGALINYVMRLFLNKREKDFKEKDFINFFNEAKIFTNKEIPIKFYVAPNENRHFNGLNDINILNIAPNSQRGEIFLAALHYIFKKSKETIELLEKTIGNNSKIIVIGRNAKNKFVIHEKAKILNRPLFIDKTGEIVALGAALLGGIGAGVFVNYEDAVKNLNREEEEINP